MNKYELSEETWITLLALSGILFIAGFIEYAIWVKGYT